MPRPYIGPKLWLDPRRGTYTILDGRKRTRTSFTEVEHDRACEALLAYSGGVERPAARPAPVRTYKVPPKKGVYVAGFGPYVKIGVSVNIAERMISLQMPEPVQLYGVVEGWLNKEMELHRRFGAYRLKGEWFRNEGGLADWINGGCK